MSGGRLGNVYMPNPLGVIGVDDASSHSTWSLVVGIATSNQRWID